MSIILLSILVQSPLSFEPFCGEFQRNEIRVVNARKHYSTLISMFSNAMVCQLRTGEEVIQIKFYDTASFKKAYTYLVNLYGSQVYIKNLK